MVDKQFRSRGFLEYFSNREPRLIGMEAGGAVGRKNYLFFGSDKGGESAAIIYSLLVTCKLNGVGWLREVIVKLNDWPSNRVHELLSWNFSGVK